MYSSETVTRRGRFAHRLPAGALGEQRLARLVARGDQPAFEAVFERYHGELYSYCRAILGDPEEAEDALQSTMTIALHHLPGLERRTSLRGWLYRVAHNEAISILRRRTATVDSDGLPDVAGPSAYAQLEQRDRLRRLVADLRRLPDRQRGALVMRELSDMSYPEIAAAIDTSEAAARQVVYEARESLRALEVGRDMDCASARRAISERDGRRLRGRRLRAHLSVCAPCGDFQAAIGARRRDLTALYPPLVPLAASSLLASLLGGWGSGGTSGSAAGTAGATTGAGAAGGSVAASGAGSAALGGVGLKAASIVSVVALGAGAAGISSGGIKLPVVDHAHQAASRPAPTSRAESPTPSTHTRAPAAPAAQDEPSHGQGSSSRASSHPTGGPPATVPAQTATHGKSAARVPNGPPAATPGSSQSNPSAHAEANGSAGAARSTSAPGLDRAATAHATPDGKSGATPAASAPSAPSAWSNHAKTPAPAATRTRGPARR